MSVFCGNIKINKEFLNNNPQAFCVLSDDIEHKSIEKENFDKNRTLGFITRKTVEKIESSFYRPEEYFLIFFEELKRLKQIIDSHPDKCFYFSPIGLEDNKYYIWQKLIQYNLLRTFKNNSNVYFCWDPQSCN